LSAGVAAKKPCCKSKQVTARFQLEESREKAEVPKRIPDKLEMS